MRYHEHDVGDRSQLLRPLLPVDPPSYGSGIAHAASFHMKRPARSTRLKPLDFHLGTWRTSGREVNGSTSGRGTDRYEPAVGGAFLLHTVDVHMGRKEVQVIELIGPDPKSRSFSLRSFDNNGGFTAMTARTAGKGILRISGDGMRAELKAVGRDRMVARWERSEDGWTWRPWMTMEFKRAAGT
jgi:hypothetical protein